MPRCQSCQSVLTSEEAQALRCPVCGVALRELQNTSAITENPTKVAVSSQFAVADLESPMVEVRGDRAADRVLAYIGDNFLAMIGAVSVAYAVGAGRGAGDLVNWTIVITLYLAYFFLSEWLIGATPAKLVFGLRVRQLSGEKCTWRQAGIRTLFRLVEVNPLLVGGLPAGVMVLATKRRQRLGDMIAGTVVVRT